jgi:hypothetical protein
VAGGPFAYQVVIISRQDCTGLLFRRAVRVDATYRLFFRQE